MGARKAPRSESGPRRVTVRAPSRRYDVLVGMDLLASCGPLVRGVVGPASARATVIHDGALPRALVHGVERGLSRAGFFVASVEVEASEGNKTLGRLEAVLSCMAAHKHERHDPVVALGGGVVGDLAGFAAGVHRRGVPLVQCPTTLLAMVDASAGGKTGANLEVSQGGAQSLLKNALGVFHQPHLVLIDPLALSSLPERTFRAGLGECVKHAMLAGSGEAGSLFEWMESNASILTRNDPMVVQLITRNVKFKAGVVAKDEREEHPSAGRALLNLGHTFAHAMETLPGLRLRGQGEGIQHGEAVALGLVAASATAECLDMIPGTLRARVDALIARLGLPLRVAGLPANQALVARMAHDKKTRSGTLRLILPCDVGRARVVEAPEIDAVRAGWDAIRA